jgi:hypothetical protein
MTKRTKQVTTPHTKCVGNFREGWETALGDAAQAGDLELIKQATDCPNGVNAPLSSWGQSALHIAASFGQVECVAWLLHYGGAAIDLVDNEGWTPLMCAAMGDLPGCPEVMQLLIATGANMDLKDKVRSCHPRRFCFRCFVSMPNSLCFAIVFYGRYLLTSVFAIVFCGRYLLNSVFLPSSSAGDTWPLFCRHLLLTMLVDLCLLWPFRLW